MEISPEALAEVEVERFLPAVSFREMVETRSRQCLSRCFQCKKCSGGCPMTFAMDILPHQLVRLIQLGRQEKCLSSKTIWVCACCKTCLARCPNDIDISTLADTLKQYVIAQGRVAGVAESPVFHDCFLASVRGKGRLHELGMMGSYKIKTRSYTRDVFPLGIKMFRKGKLKVFAQGIRGKREIQAIFDRAKEKGL